jgi:hypothetical protein
MIPGKFSAAVSAHGRFNAAISAHGRFSARTFQCMDVSAQFTSFRLGKRIAQRHLFKNC